MNPASKRTLSRLLLAVCTAAAISAGEYAAADTSSPVVAVRNGATLMRIVGSNFGQEMGYATVALSGKKLHVVSWADNQVDVLLPADAVAGPLLITTPSGVSKSVAVSIAYTEEQQRYVNARSVYVDAKAAGSGNGTKASPFRTIGEALNNLPQASPRYVFVAPGTYKERINITKSHVNLIGSGPADTVIDGRGVNGVGGPVVTIGNGGYTGGVNHVTVSGFTVTGGSVNYMADGGGGIFGDFGNKNIDINNNVIRNNGGEYGGGIWLHFSNHDVDIWSNEIYSNGNTGGYGGGISVCDEPEYEDYGGQPPEGSATHHTWDDHLTGPPPGTYHVYNNKVFSNFSMDYGGAMSFYELKDRMLIYGNLILGNKSDDHGGGIFMEESGPAEIHGNVFARNYAADDGGAISLEDVGDDISTVQIYNNLLVENVADDRDENSALGGAIGLDDALYVSIFNNTMAGNVVAGSLSPVGGAIGSERHGHEYKTSAPGFSDAKIHNNLIWSNWRLKYEPHKIGAEGLNYKMGKNYKWMPDDLFNDDPRVNASWSQKVNSNSFSAVRNNVISGGIYGNTDADTLFTSPEGLPWFLAPGTPDGRSATSGVPVNEVGKPGPSAPWTNSIVNGAMLDSGAVMSAMYAGSGSDVFGLKLATADPNATVLADLSVPANQTLSGVTVAPASGSVSGVAFPYGTIAFSTTTPDGGCVNSIIHLSEALPSRTALYRVSGNSGKFKEIPLRKWTQSGPSSIELRMCDGRDDDGDDDINGGHASARIAIGSVVNLAPVASAGEDMNIFLGQGVILDGSASSDPNGDFIMSHAWEIQDAPEGSTAILSGANSKNPSFIPDLEGQYDIALVVNDGNMNSAADTVRVTVSQNMAPSAAINASALNGPAPMSVNFSGAGSSDPEGYALTYAWDFGDNGATGNGISASHTYSQPGTYTAMLTVTDHMGNTDEAAVEITAEVYNAPPSVSVSASPFSGLAPLNVQLASGASDPEGALLTYEWDFGDGSPVATVADPAHVYGTPGSYTATVKVSDGANTVTRSTTITVRSVLSVNVTEAKLNAGKEAKGKVNGEINMKASFVYNGSALTSGDVVKIVFDGETILQAPYSKFKNKGGKMVYSDRNVNAKIDFTNGAITLSGHKMSFKKVQPTDGIDVVVTFGASAATDSFSVEVEDITRKKFSYKDRTE